jgi:hypothetical protein
MGGSKQQQRETANKDKERPQTVTVCQVGSEVDFACAAITTRQALKQGRRGKDGSTFHAGRVSGETKLRNSLSKCLVTPTPHHVNKTWLPKWC